MLFLKEVTLNEYFSLPDESTVEVSEFDIASVGARTTVYNRWCKGTGRVHSLEDKVYYNTNDITMMSQGIDVISREMRMWDGKAQETALRSATDRGDGRGDPMVRQVLW